MHVLLLTILGLCAPAEAIKIGFFGVFDGHGGKAAATFASRHVLPLLQNALKDPSAPEDGEASGSQASGSASSDGGHSPMGDTPATANAAELKDVAGLRADVAAAGVTEVALAANECADMLVEALPAALVQAFAATEREFFTHSQVCGSRLWFGPRHGHYVFCLTDCHRIDPPVQLIHQHRWYP